MAITELNIIYKGTPLKITGEQAALVSLTDAQKEVIAGIAADIAQIEVNTTGALRTPSIIRTSGSGNVNTVRPTFYSVSVANVGTADGSILGGVNNLKSGEILNFDSGSLNNTFDSFAYDATGTEFIITFIS
jgi:hypothetical protein